MTTPVPREDSLEALRMALKRLCSPDEMGGMGITEDMTGPAAVELRARMRFACAALAATPSTPYWCGGPQNGQPKPHAACTCTPRPATTETP